MVVESASKMLCNFYVLPVSAECVHCNFLVFDLFRALQRECFSLVILMLRRLFASRSLNAWWHIATFIRLFCIHSKGKMLGDFVQMALP